MKEQKATRTENCRGAVWRWPHWSGSSLGLKAAEYEVREIADKDVVVILCQDGISGDEDEADEGDELVAQANELLRYRWVEMKLMDEIVKSKEFGAGDFKGGLEAAFKRVDERVEKRVGKMVKEMSKLSLDWTLPAVWRAVYNSLAVIITRKEVYMAGAGTFKASVISRDKVCRISSGKDVLLAGVKPDIADGVGEDALEITVRSLAAGVAMVKRVTFDDSFRKYELKEGDECIVVERSTCMYRGGSTEWLKYSKDWGAGLTSLSTEDWGYGVHFEAILLELGDGQSTAAVCCSNQVPEQASPPSKNMSTPSRLLAQASPPRPSKKHKLTPLLEAPSIAAH